MNINSNLIISYCVLYLIAEAAEYNFLVGHGLLSNKRSWQHIQVVYEYVWYRVTLYFLMLVKYVFHLFILKKSIKYHVNIEIG